MTVADLMHQLNLLCAKHAEVRILTDDAVEKITNISPSNDYKTVYIFTSVKPGS